MSFLAGVERGINKFTSTLNFILFVIMISAVSGVGVGSWKFDQVTASWKPHHINQATAHYKRLAGVEWGDYFLRVPSVMPKGNQRYYRDPKALDRWLDHQWLKYYAKPMRRIEIWAISGTMLGGALFILYSFLFMNKKDSFRRGAEIVNSEKLIAMVKRKSRKKPNYQIANVPIPYTAEYQHLMFLGGPGAGKSQAIEKMLIQARRAGDKVICFDPAGEFQSHHWKEGDHILNPFDERSEAWDPMNEIEEPMDADALAFAAIQPSAGEQSSKYFYEGAQAIMAELAGQIKRNMIKNDLVHWLLKSDVKTLEDVLAGTDAFSYVDTKAKGQGGGGLVSTMKTKIKAWKYLSYVKGDPFSIRKWVRDDKAGWLWLTSIDNDQISLESLLSTWIETAAREMLSRKPHDHKQQTIWVVIDELASLQRLPALLQLLAKGRKFGVIVLLATQNPSQIEAIYKKEGKRAMMGTIGLWLLNRLKQPEDAEEGSKMIGDVEIMRTNENHNTGKAGKGHATSSQVVKERAVMAAQIQYLPDLKGYLLLPGDYPVAKVKTKHVEYKEVSPAIVRREIGWITPQKEPREEKKLGIDLSSLGDK